MNSCQLARLSTALIIHLVYLYASESWHINIYYYLKLKCSVSGSKDYTFQSTLYYKLHFKLVILIWCKYFAMS